jgi:F0F1-type ATP synthase assembly protein I
MADQLASEAEFAKTVAWLLRVQALLIVVCAVAFALLGGLPQAVAALAGGAIGVLLTAISGIRLLLSQGREAKQLVQGFYRAMALKFVLAVILFVIVAKWFAGYFVPVVTGYTVTLMAYWLAMRRLSVS